MRIRMLVASTLALLCTLLPLLGKIYSDRLNGTMMSGFRPLYCGALAMRKDANPYRARTLQSCEEHSPRPYFRTQANDTVPAPYPPYVFALISPLTFIPFSHAAPIWWLILCASCIVAAVTLARIAHLPFLVCWAALALSLGLSSIPSGQLLPLSVTGLLLAAFFAQRGNWGYCALGLALAMVEPHLALPAAVACYFRYRPIRTVLVAAFALLGALSIEFGHLSLNAAYLSNVVPHTTVVIAFYVVLLAAGVFIGIKLAHRYYEPAFVVLIPPVLTLIDGSFVHTVEIAAAIPVCLLLYARRDARRRALVAPLILLAVPWAGSMTAALFLAPLFPIAYLAYVLGGRRRIFALTSALASLGIIALYFALGPHTIPRIDAAQIAALFATRSDSDPVTWLSLWPTYLGLAGLVAILSKETGLLRAPRLNT